MALIALTPVQEAAAGVLVTKGILRKDVAPDLARAHRFLAQAADALAQLPAISSPAVAFNIAYDKCA